MTLNKWQKDLAEIHAWRSTNLKEVHRQAREKIREVYQDGVATAGGKRQFARIMGVAEFVVHRALKRQ